MLNLFWLYCIYIFFLAIFFWRWNKVIYKIVLWPRGEWCHMQPYANGRSRWTVAEVVTAVTRQRSEENEEEWRLPAQRAHGRTSNHHATPARTLVLCNPHTSDYRILRSCSKRLRRKCYFYSFTVIAAFSVKIKMNIQYIKALRMVRVTGITQFYVPPTRLSTNWMNHPAFTPSCRASPHFGRHLFLVPQRVGGWVGLGGWLHTEMVCPPKDGSVTRPSTNWPIVRRSGIELTRISDALTTRLPSNRKKEKCSAMV